MLLTETVGFGFTVKIFVVLPEHEPVVPIIVYVVVLDGDTGKLAERIEEVEGVEILSMGNGLELIKGRHARSRTPR